MDAKAAYDSLAEHYDCDFVKPISKAEDGIVMRLLEEGGYTEGVIVDLGCGSGLLLDNVQIEFSRYLGIDISPKMLELAQSKHPHYAFLEADMQDLGLLEFMDSFGRFDNAIILFGGINYCDNPQSVIMYIRKLLKPNGRFFIMFCGKRYHKRRLYIANRYHLDVPMAVYDEAELREMFQRFDVKISGLNIFGDWIPGVLTANYLEWEIKYLSQRYLDRNYFLIVEGKNESIFIRECL